MPSSAALTARGSPDTFPHSQVGLLPHPHADAGRLRLGPLSLRQGGWEGRLDRMAGAPATHTSLELLAVLRIENTQLCESRVCLQDSP